jgi:arylsulfatase A-like enzyme
MQRHVASFSGNGGAVAGDDGMADISEGRPLLDRRRSSLRASSNGGKAAGSSPPPLPAATVRRGRKAFLFGIPGVVTLYGVVLLLAAWALTQRKEMGVIGEDTDDLFNTTLSGDIPAFSPPHIIMLLVDDMGYNDVGWAGDDFEGLTPTLSELQDNGVELGSYYTQQLCTPSRAALLTGRYPFRTGMQSEVIQPVEDWGLPLEYELLPQFLKPLGYESYAIGKWHLGHASDAQLPHKRGFDAFYGLVSDQTHYCDHTSPTAGILDFMEAGGDYWWCVTDEAVNGIYSTTLHTDYALRVVDEWSAGDQSAPLFLYMAYQSPHYPLEPDESLDYTPIQSMLDGIPDPSRKAAAKMVYGMDMEIDRLLSGLRVAGVLDDNYILAWASDNGGCPMHGLSNYPLRGTKHYTFEGGSHVRSFVQSPLLPSASGSVYNDLFHVTDWLPTFLAAAGLPDLGESQDIDGLSHWEALKMVGTSSEGSEPVRTEIVYNLQEVRAEDVTTGSSEGLVPRGAIRVGDWKLVMNEACQVWEDFGSRYSESQFALQCGSNPTKSCGAPDGELVGTWLFNLAQDPNETTDQMAQEPDIASTLVKRMGDLARTGRPSEWSGAVTSSETVEAAWAQSGCISPWLTVSSVTR